MQVHVSCDASLILILPIPATFSNVKTGGLLRNTQQGFFKVSSETIIIAVVKNGHKSQCLVVSPQHVWCHTYVRAHVRARRRTHTLSVSKGHTHTHIRESFQVQEVCKGSLSREFLKRVTALINCPSHHTQGSRSLPRSLSCSLLRETLSNVHRLIHKAKPHVFQWSLIRKSFIGVF